jgi:hypothetical protein
MRADRLAVYTTVYPGVERFLPEWHASIRAQTDLRFDLWIGSDGLSHSATSAAAGEPVFARWTSAQVQDTPASLRGRVMRRLAARYAGVVFVDADDVLEPDRVASARAALRDRDVDGCALRMCDAAGQALDDTFGPGPEEDAAAALPARNFYGLSNTAYRGETLRRCLPLPAACALPDWLLATRAWLLGATLGFDRTPRMRYRQHDANTAPSRRPVSEAMLRAATAHVLAHHHHVLCAPWPAGRAANEARVTQVVAARDRALAFCRAVTTAPERLAAYTHALNQLPEARVPRAWWWMVAHPDLEDLWNS